MTTLSRIRRMPTSPEVIATNQDILMKIFLHLPDKTLLRLKCVCRRWRSIVSSFYFSKYHSAHNPNPPISGILLHKHPSFFYFSIGIQNSGGPSFGPVPVSDFLGTNPYATSLTILCSCNGLLLSLLTPPPWDASDVVYFVSNPTTQKSFPLPTPELISSKPIITMDLFFDTRFSAHFRVICIRHSTTRSGPVFSIEIFSPETGSWRICSRSYSNIPAGRGGVCWNGSIHYLSSCGRVALFFTLENESLNPLPLPPTQGEIDTVKRYLAQCEDYLYLVDIQTYTTQDDSIDVYVLLEDYSGWNFMYRVDLGHVGSIFQETIRYIGIHDLMFDGPPTSRIGKYYVCFVMSLVRRDEEDLFQIVLSVPNKIVAYDPRNGAYRVLVYFGDDDGEILGHDWHNVVHYRASLEPILMLDV